MRTPGWVLRSLHPEDTAPQIEAAVAARRAAIDAMNDWCDEMFGKDSGWEPGVFKRVDGSIYMTGIIGSGDPPGGFRKDRKGYFVPKRSTPLGASALREIDALGFEWPLIDGLGGIVSTRDLDTGEGYFAGFRFVVLTMPRTAVFACLSHPPDEDRKGATALAYDPERWEPCPLSAYHGAREVDEGYAALRAQAEAARVSAPPGTVT